MSKKKSGKNQQNSAALKKERQKISNAASYIGMAIAIGVLGIVAGILFAINFVPNKVCCTAAGVEVKRDIYECCYFYDTVSSMKLSDYGYDNTKSPYEQKFSGDAVTGDYDTWGDYFEELTDNTLAFCYGMINKADESGYSYSESVQTKIDEEISGIQSKANESGVKFDNYTHVVYGAKIKESTLREYLDVYYKAMDFYNSLVNDKELFFKEFSSNQKALEAKYDDMKDSWDVMTLRYFAVRENYSQKEKMISEFRAAESEETFKNLASRYYAGENAADYNEQDGSLYDNYSISQLSAYVSENVKAKLLTAKAGDIIEENREIGSGDSKEKVTEFYYVVKARSQDNGKYEKTDILVWEHSAMAKIIDEYFTERPVEKNDSGMKNFIKHIDIVVPETTAAA